MNYNPDLPYDSVTGRNAPGPRFRFRNRFISRKTYWLPIAIRTDEEFQKLLKALDAFGANINDIKKREEFRTEFNKLRLKYDFAFWAANFFRIHHVDDADRIVTLILNDSQRFIADYFDEANAKNIPLRFIISKNNTEDMAPLRRIGVTTVVNAYICWTQTARCPGRDSMTITETGSQSIPLRNNFLRMGIQPTDPVFRRKTYDISTESINARYKIYFPDIKSSAFFATAKNPDATHGLSYLLLHVADMAGWTDPNRKKSDTLVSGARPPVSKDTPQSMIILEGNASRRNPYFIWTLVESLRHEAPYVPILLPVGSYNPYHNYPNIQ